jgi:hypothetical protein
MTAAERIHSLLTQHQDAEARWSPWPSGNDEYAFLLIDGARAETPDT